MTLEELERIVPEPLTGQLRSRYAEFIQLQGSGELDLFVEHLRNQGLLSPEVFRDIHARDEVSIDDLTGLAGRMARGGTQPQSSNDDATAAVPALQERHQVLGLIGMGGMATVHVARDHDLGRKVAYKQLNPALRNDPRIKNRFFGEVQITAQLDHPNIVPVYDLLLDGEDGPAYSMKLIEGKTLRQIIAEAIEHHARKNPLPEELKLETRLDHFLKVCDALSYAHDKGVIHRDLKPDNIMVGRFGAVYVMDWGLARVIGSGNDGRVSVVHRLPTDPGIENTQVGAVLGSPAYMSPEQALGKHTELDARADVFALGLVLFELVSLRQALGGAGEGGVLMRASQGKKVPLQHVAGHPIRPELASIIDKATRVAPADRYDSAGALAEDIRRYLHDEAVSAHRDGPVRKLQRWLARNRQATLRIIAGVLLLALASLGWGFYRQAELQRGAREREEKLGKFMTVVGHQANEIDSHLLRIQAQLEALAASASERLSSPSQGKQRIHLSEDYLDPRRGPPDVSDSPHYGAMISIDHAVFKLAPGVKRADVEPLLQRLAPLRVQLRRMLVGSHSSGSLRLSKGKQRRLIKDKGVPITWAYLGLKQGAHLGYPGQGSYPEDYDPRKRPWYKLASGLHGARWGEPYVDAKGQGLMLPCSVSVYDAAGDFAGVAGVDLTLRYIIDSLLSVPGVRYIRETYLLDDEGRIVVRSSDRARATKGKGEWAKRLEMETYPFSEVVDRISSRESGYARVEQEDGPRIVGHYRLGALGWYFVAEALADDVLGGS